uniref:Uncharacterized protein n=1 Tax=Oryza rufipogon TaxID=4529 RepID=A0A0E0QMD6_ORYRU
MRRGGCRRGGLVNFKGGILTTSNEREYRLWFCSVKLWKRKKGMDQPNQTKPKDNKASKQQQGEKGGEGEGQSRQNMLHSFRGDAGCAPHARKKRVDSSVSSHSGNLVVPAAPSDSRRDINDADEWQCRHRQTQPAAGVVRRESKKGRKRLKRKDPNTTISWESLRDGPGHTRSLLLWNVAVGRLVEKATGVPSLTTNPSRASNTIIFELFLPPFKCDTIARLGFGVVNKLFVEVEPVAPFESEDSATTLAQHRNINTYT